MTQDMWNILVADDPNLIAWRERHRQGKARQKLLRTALRTALALGTFLATAFGTFYALSAI